MQINKIDTFTAILFLSSSRLTTSWEHPFLEIIRSALVTMIDACVCETGEST